MSQTFSTTDPRNPIRKVGVFDSGAGGLTVVKSLLEHNLFEEIIYYGDTARVPYGPKDPVILPFPHPSKSRD